MGASTFDYHNLSNPCVRSCQPMFVLPEMSFVTGCALSLLRYGNLGDSG